MQRLPLDMPIRRSVRPAVPDIVCVSRAMQSVMTMAARFAVVDEKILITGESGVGKDLIARYIHAYSSRAARPFVAVNCAGIPDELLESELFGHVRGSFTGARGDTIGKLVLAHRGTVFLDEVAEMSSRMQAVLLRFLESGEIQPVGAVKPDVRVNVRVITATNRDLSDLLSSGSFREDLLYRIQVGRIHVPPLRQRPDDVPALVEHLVKRSGREVQFTGEAMAALVGYRWPGNVRELRNVVERAVWMSESDVIDRDCLAFLGPPACRSNTRSERPDTARHCRRRANRVSDPAASRSDVPSTTPPLPHSEPRCVP